MAKALSLHVVPTYAKLVGNVVKLDSVEALKQERPQHQRLDDRLENPCVLRIFGNIFLAPLMVVAHTLNHTELSKRKEDVKGLDNEVKELSAKLPKGYRERGFTYIK